MNINLPAKYITEKTFHIKINGNDIPLYSFTNEIIKEFEVFDKMKQDMAELSYKLEIMRLAIKAKSNELTVMVSEHLKQTMPIASAVIEDVDK